MRAVVVGASSGLGRCIGVGLARRGARVALMARRADRLAAAATEAGGDAVPITCDVTDAGSCAAAAKEAADALGGVDAYVYTPAVGPLARIADVDAETWHRAFDTNVVGAALMTSALLPYLKESGGTAAFLSSTSASQTAPWPGLGAYAVTKAALDKLVEVWRVEHPSVGFTRVVVGNCAGGEGDSQTGFTAGWDMQLAAEVGAIWYSNGYLTPALLEVDEVVRVVESVLVGGATTSIPSVVVTPRVPQSS